MTNLRQILARHRAFVRIVFLLLVINQAQPIQLVWCNETNTNSEPQMELALDSQCLSGFNQSCCSDTISTAPDVRQINGPGHVFANPDEHNHCVGCSDELLNKPSTALLLSTPNELQGNSPSGCLFITSPIEYQDKANLGFSGWQTSNRRTAAAISAHSHSICLLI